MLYGMARHENSPTNRGKGTFRLVFVLIILLGIAAFFWPVLQTMFPEQTAVVDRLRGAYSGPEFQPLPDGREGLSPGTPEITFVLSEEPEVVYFVPAADREFTASATTQYLDDVRLDVLDPESGETIDSNTNYPAFTGRAADQWADSGEEPSWTHASGVDVKVAQGRLYGLRVTPEDPATVGQTVTVTATVTDNALGIMSLWGILSGALVVLAIGGLVLGGMRRMRRDRRERG